MNIASVRFDKEDKDTIIYISDTKELFNTARYSGFIRSISAERIDRPRGIAFLNNYKLVLFLDKDTCDADVINIVMNAETSRTGVTGIDYIKVKRYFLDSLDNLKKEVKSNLYLKYRIVIADLEVEEQICKTKLTCN